MKLIVVLLTIALLSGCGGSSVQIEATRAAEVQQLDQPPAPPVYEVQR